MSATFTKIQSGDWGVRVIGQSISAEAKLTVMKKDGSTQTVTVASVLSDKDGVATCSIVSDKEKSGSSSSSRTVCGECGKGGRLVPDMEDGILKHWGCCDMPPGG